jgi:hypothetical protein
MFQYRNTEYDTKEKVINILKSIKENIINKNIIGSYEHIIGDSSFLFVHGGLRPKMIEHIAQQHHITDINSTNIVKAINNELVSAISKCPDISTSCNPHVSNKELFDAAAERGGIGIGGPFWTDFGILMKPAIDKELYTNYNFVQV